MAAGLAARGHQVTLVAPVDSPRTEQDVQVIPTGLSGKRERILGARRLLDRLADVDAQIYHFHDPELLPWMTWFRRRQPARRVVYDVHEYYPDAVVGSNYFGWRLLTLLGAGVFRIAEPVLGRRLDGIVGATQPIADRFRGGRAQVTVARNLPRLANLPQTTERIDFPSRHTIVLAGIADESRCMGELVTALASLLNRWPDTRLLCIGDLRASPYGQRLRAHARDVGFAEHLEYRPRMPWARAQAHLAGSAVGLVLYSDRPNNRMGLPNRLFEFMAHGVPIVATDFPLLREIVEGAQCGLLVDSADPQSLAAAIARLFERPAEGVALGERGRNAVLDTYNWEKEITRVEALYDAIL